MANKIILTDVDNDTLLTSQSVKQAVPFAISTAEGVSQLGMSIDGTVSGVRRFPLTEFGEVQVVTTPIVTSPGQGSTVNPILTIKTSPWSHLYRRAQYSATLEIYTDAQLTQRIHRGTHLGEVSEFPFGLYELPGSTTLYVRVYKDEVAPYDTDSRLGQWSDVISFTTMRDPYIYTPSIISTVPAYADDSTVGVIPTFTTSPFTYWGVIAQTHVSTVWVLTDVSTGVSVEKVSNGTTIAWDQLDYSTQYSLKCKHVGDTLHDSEWSVPLVFTTEHTPFMNVPVITYPVSGSDTPYFYVQLETPVAYHRSTTPIATRFIIKDKLTGTVYRDRVRVLSGHSAPVWTDPHLGGTDVVNTTNDLLWVDFGPMSGGILSSNSNSVPMALGRDMSFEAYVVDATYGVSTTSALYPAQAPCTGIIVTPTTTFYSASITAPADGAAGISISPNIVSSIVPRVWTYPAGTWSNTGYTRTVSVKNAGGAVVWSKSSASASEPVTIPLAELSTYSATLSITDAQFGYTKDYAINTFSNNDVYMSFANPSGGILPWLITPSENSTNTANSTNNVLVPTFTIPQPTFVNVPSTLSIDIDAVTWSLTNTTSGIVEASTTSLSYTYTPTVSLHQNTTYLLTAVYSTNHPEYIPDLTLYAYFTTGSVVCNAPIVVTKTGISPLTDTISVTLAGVRNPALLSTLTPRTGMIQLDLSTSASFTTITTFYKSIADITLSNTHTVAVNGLSPSTQYYARAKIVSNSEQYISSSSYGATASITTTVAPTNYTSITSPDNNATITNQSLTATTASTANIPVPFSTQLIFGNEYTRTRVIYSVYHPTVTQVLQISTDASFATLVYAQSVTLVAGWEGNYVTYKHGDDWGEPVGIPRASGNGPATIDLPITITLNNVSTSFGINTSALPDGTYYIRTNLMSNLMANSVSTSTIIATNTRQFTYAPTAAKKWGGVFNTLAETSYYMQGVYGRAGLCTEPGNGVYNVRLYSITDAVSKTRLYRSSGRWYFSFTPSERYIGVTALNSSINISDGTLTLPGLLWFIPPLKPLRTGLADVAHYYPLTTTTGGDWYVMPTGDDLTHRTQGVDYWWAVVDLDRGHVELYDPTGINVINLRMTGWTAGLSMTLAICTFDYSVSQTIGERSRVYYDTITDAPYVFSTVQTVFTAPVYWKY